MDIQVLQGSLEELEEPVAPPKGERESILINFVTCVIDFAPLQWC